MAKNDTTDTTKTTETTDAKGTPEQRLAERIATFLVENGFFEELALEGIRVTDDDAPAEGDEGEGDEGDDAGKGGKGGVRIKMGATNGSTRSAATGKGR